MNNNIGLSMGYMYDNGDDRYPEFEQVIKARFNSIVGEKTPLFTTDVVGLFDVFLDNLPSEAQQHYNCNACRNFVNRFGGLVTITNVGDVVPVMWDETYAPSFFKPSVRAMLMAIKKAKVNGVFLSEERVLGQPVTGEWTHMSVMLPKTMIFGSKLETNQQKMAEKREDYGMLQRALAEYSLSTIKQAVTFLKSEALYRSEKTLGIAEWFLDLHINRQSVKSSRNRDNVVWRAVATAPVGFCHVKSSMIGTLLDDIQIGMTFDQVKRRFDDKMNPLKYQRPQASPSKGNIQQAEKIVEKLGIQPSLERRFARLDEIETIWKPRNKAMKESFGGVFGHLMPKEERKEPTMSGGPTVTMTWRKFAETVLPTAESIEYRVGWGNDNFTAITTAVDEEAPPILQWDNEERRNPFSWYMYSLGSSASVWNISTGWRKVTGITYQPSMWYEENKHQGKGVIIILDEAKDTRYKSAGNALFPEILKSELREIRSTIEAFSRNKKLEGYKNASACGINLQYGSNWDAVVRVKNATGTVTYKLDRWD